MGRQRPPKETSRQFTVPLTAGIANFSAAPILQFWKSGKRTYVWIGNNLEGVDNRCFALLSGEATLRKLAKAILREVGS
jgi:hypothetical protein